MYGGPLKVKKINIEKLIDYGFKYYEVQNKYTYKRKIMAEKMEIIITIKILEDISIDIKVMDILIDDEYDLYKVPSANGVFITKVRQEVELCISDILKNCFEENEESRINNKQKQQIINYIIKKYGDKQEYLWEKSPTSSIIRRKDNQKWYVVFMNISSKKLGIETDQNIDVINVRVESQEIEKLLKRPGYFPAYHMNKKNWISISLEGELEIQEIFEKIELSYNLVCGKRKKGGKL